MTEVRAIEYVTLLLITAQWPSDQNQDTLAVSKINQPHH